MAKQVIDETKNGEMTYVSLRSIRTDIYKNMRDMAKERGTDHIQEMRSSLKALGQQQSVQVEKVVDADGKETGEYALIIGFCRTEAMIQNALDPIARKHNKNLAESGGNTAPKLDVTNYNDQVYIAENYKEEYAKAMAYQVKANIVVVPGETQAEKEDNALAMNMTENFVRKDPSVAEFAYRVLALSERGKSAKDIEKITGVDHEKLKQNITIGSVFNKKYLMDYITKMDDGAPNIAGGWSDLQRKAWNEAAEKIVNEVIRRMSISKKDNPPKHSLAIGFSHLREVAARFNSTGAKRVHRMAAFELLVDLVGWSAEYVYNEEGEYADIVLITPEKSDVPDYGVWKNQIKAADARSTDLYNQGKGLYGGLFDAEEATTADAATDKAEQVSVEAKANTPAATTPTATPTATGSTVPAATPTDEASDDATTPDEINDAILEGDDTAVPGAAPAADGTAPTPAAVAKGKRAEKDETELPMRPQVVLVKFRKDHMTQAVEIMPDPYNPDGLPSEGPVNIAYCLGFAAGLAYAFTDDESSKMYDNIRGAVEKYEDQYEAYIRKLETKLTQAGVKLDGTRPYLSEIINADGTLISD